MSCHGHSVVFFFKYIWTESLLFNHLRESTTKNHSYTDTGFIWRMLFLIKSDHYDLGIERDSAPKKCSHPKNRYDIVSSVKNKIYFEKCLFCYNHSSKHFILFSAEESKSHDNNCDYKWTALNTGNVHPS